MGTKSEMYVEIDGTQCPVAPANRGELTLDEAMRVEKLSNIPFWSIKPGDFIPLPMWAAILTVQIQRTLPPVQPAAVRKLTVDDLRHRMVDDGEPDAPTTDGVGEPDPTDGEGSSDASSPTSGSGTSEASPTS